MGSWQRTKRLLQLRAEDTTAKQRTAAVRAKNRVFVYRSQRSAQLTQLRSHLTLKCSDAPTATIFFHVVVSKNKI